MSIFKGVSHILPSVAMFQMTHLGIELERDAVLDGTRQHRDC